MRPMVRRMSLLSLGPALCLQAQAPPSPAAATTGLARPSQAALVIPQQIPPLPPAVTQRLASLLPRLQPTVRAWVDDQARRQRSLPALDLDAIRSAARTRFPPPAKSSPLPATKFPGTRPAAGTVATAAPPLAGLGSMDIDALVQLVLAQCAKDTETDLKAMLNDLQKHQKQKAEMKAIKEELGKERASKERASTRPYDTLCDSPNCRILEGRLRALAVQLPAKARFTIQPIATMGDLARVEASLKGSLDALSEMGEVESLRLQMAMDRMSKLMSTLSNLLKKASETSDAIIANLK